MKRLFEEQIELQDERVKLSPLSIHHFNDLLPIALEYPNLLQFSPPGWGTREALENYINNGLALREKKQKYPFAIFDKVRNELVGSTSFMQISEQNKSLEIGSTWISPKVQGTGLNKHCKHLLLKYVFEDLAFERVEFRTDERNIQSRKALESLGAIYEGCLRSHTVLADGFRRETVVYSILKTDNFEGKMNV